MKKETLADRLNLAMEQSGMSQGALAKASGVAQPTIWRLTSGNARGSTKIVEIANALGVRTEWLSSGIGPMRNDGQQSGKPAANHPKYFKIDVLDIEVSAGPGVINREFVEVLRSVEYDDTAHVKRLQMMKDKLLVISDNKSYSPWDPIEKDEMNRVFIFGKVIGSMPQTYRKHG